MVLEALALDVCTDGTGYGSPELYKQNSGPNVMFVLKDLCCWGNLVLGLS